MDGHPPCLPPICRSTVAQACFIIEQDKISRGVQTKGWGISEGSRRRGGSLWGPNEGVRSCLVRRPLPDSPCATELPRPPPSPPPPPPSPPSLSITATLPQHRSPHLPPGLHARDRCSAAAKPTLAAVVCASSLAPPVALLSACGVSVTHARASLAPPCRVWAAPLACLCCAALLLLHEKPI